MLTATSSDGSTVHAFDEGDGPTVLILHGGMDDGRAWRNVAGRLLSRYRVVRLSRREYRADAPSTMAQEVDDVRAVANVIGEPVLLVAHSSGGVLGLETMVAAPSLAAGAVIYEPPVRTGPLLAGDAAPRVRAAIAAGRPGRALRIFARDIGGMPPWQALLGGLYTAIRPRYRALAATQLHFEQIEELGVRLDAYAQITAPTILLGGDRSPSHIGERLDALERALPHAERVTLRGQGHHAFLTAPDALALIIADHAGAVLRRAA